MFGHLSEELVQISWPSQWFIWHLYFVIESNSPIQKMIVVNKIVIVGIDVICAVSVINVTLDTIARRDNHSWVRIISNFSLNGQNIYNWFFFYILQSQSQNCLYTTYYIYVRDSDTGQRHISWISGLYCRRSPDTSRNVPRAIDFDLDLNRR